MKKINIGIISFCFVVCILFISCKTDWSNDRVNIYGYSIGDTITGEFEVKDTMDLSLKLAEYKSDNRFKVTIVNNHIYKMWFSKLDKTEHNNNVKNITKTLNVQPEYLKGYTPEGIKINGEVFYWRDSLSGDLITLARDTDSNNVFSILTVNNEEILKKLTEEYIPKKDSADIKFETFEEE